MSLQSKRDVQLGPGPSLNPTKTSQVARPVTKPGSDTNQACAKRVLHLDRLNVVTTPDMMCSSVKNIRNASAIPLKKTPNRGIQNLRLPSTNEKVHSPVYDKQIIKVQAISITEYLRVIEPVLGKNFFIRGGLKSMSSRQFIVIVNHFLKLIAGNRLFVGENHIEDIINALSKIGYPYTINKSWLKTPNAPHVLSNVVVMLRWLQTFSCSNFNINEFETNYFYQREDFLDEELARLLMTEIKEGFIFWNNSEDQEVRYLKQRLIDKIIMKRTGFRGQRELEKECARLKLELNKMRRHKPVIKNEDELIRLDKEIEIKTKHLLKSEEHCQNGKRELIALQNSIAEKEKSLNDLQISLAKIEQIVNTQEVSIQEQDKLILKIKFLEQILSSKKKLVCDLLNMAASKQVLFSRIKNQSIQLISSFNNYLNQLFEGSANTEKDIIQEFYLDQKSPDDIFNKLDKVEPLLENQRKRNLAEYNKYTKSLYKLENVIRTMVYEYDKVLIPILNLKRKYCSDLEKKINHINTQIAEADAKNTEEVEKRTKSLNILIDSNNQIINKISHAEEELKTLIIQNELMMTRITNKVNEILTFKENRIEKLNDAVNSFLTTLEDVNLSLNAVTSPDVNK